MHAVRHTVLRSQWQCKTHKYYNTLAMKVGMKLSSRDNSTTKLKPESSQASSMGSTGPAQQLVTERSRKENQKYTVTTTLRYWCHAMRLQNYSQRSCTLLYCRQSSCQQNESEAVERLCVIDNGNKMNGKFQLARQWTGGLPAIRLCDVNFRKKNYRWLWIVN